MYCVSLPALSALNDCRRLEVPRVRGGGERTSRRVARNGFGELPGAPRSRQSSITVPFQVYEETTGVRADHHWNVKTEKGGL